MASNSPPDTTPKIAAILKLDSRSAYDRRQVVQVAEFVPSCLLPAIGHMRSIAHARFYGWSAGLVKERRALAIPLQPPPDQLADATNQHGQRRPVVRADLCPVSSCEPSMDSGANRSDDVIQRLLADGHARVDQSNER